MPGPDLLKYYRRSLKSDAFHGDEIVNIYILRPIASVIVWMLYPTNVTPNQVTLAAIFFGMMAAVTYIVGTPAAVSLAGSLVLLKDIVDDADGQLARAKQLYSRRGRFIDSIGDFVVDVAVFTAVTYTVYGTRPTSATLALGILSFWGITLRVSYHVYYQVSFLHLADRYTLNRIAEEITEEDRAGDPVTLRLQQVFVLLYGWQDRFMGRIDRWCRGRGVEENLLPAWYSDRSALRLSGFIGFGTEFTLLAVCSWMNELHLYLVLNVFVMNGMLILSVVYRRFVLGKKLSRINENRIPSTERSSSSPQDF